MQDSRSGFHGASECHQLQRVDYRSLWAGTALKWERSAASEQAG